ncbi:unnamed protein product [Mytilus coruscus]|uniref:Uncharacterized protein n=1 Tax=Mytilus coruscus TaxID=42192 RepID=A0A6J8E7F3_MYTCO|nr:unnamed protein product [Mytilus coruscus]
MAVLGSLSTNSRPSLSRNMTNPLSNSPQPFTSAVTNMRIASSRHDRRNMTAPSTGRPFTSCKSEIQLRQIRNDPPARLNTNERERRHLQNNDEQGRYFPDNDPREGLDRRLERDGCRAREENSGRPARRTTRELVRKTEFIKLKLLRYTYKHKSEN